MFHFLFQQVQLMCVGEGPVVHVDPVELDWGQTPVLSDLSKSVVLSNESLIPAPFICAMVSANSAHIPFVVLTLIWWFVSDY